MARKLSSDKVLFVALVALSLFGCVMIYSASAVSAAQTLGNPYKYLLKQLAALAAGGLAAFVVYRADYRLFARRWVCYGVYGLSLLLCVAALFRPPINSARRWLTLGPSPGQRPCRPAAVLPRSIEAHRLPALFHPATAPR